jgi:hydrogenase nickel incorporation protein HypA/HybF
MHELSVASAVLDTALRHAEDRRILAVSLQVGHLRQVIPDSLAFYWDIVSRDTPAEGARLDLVVVPARLRCNGCSDEWDMEGTPEFRCPRCTVSQVEVIAGNELEVDSIEVEEEERPCIASR